MSLVSSIVGSHQISKATNAQLGALNSAIENTNAAKTNAVDALSTGISGANNTLSSTLNGEQSQLQPYLDLGTQGANTLTAALAPGGNLSSTFSFDPSQVANDPGFQFTLQQGTQAVQRAAAANGTLNSGGTQKALAQYASGVASQYENQDYQQALNTFNTNRTTALQNYTLPISIGQQATGLNQNALQNYGNLTASNIFSGNADIANTTMTAANSLNDLLEGKGNASAAGSIAQGNLWGNFLGSGGLASAGKTLLQAAMPGGGNVASAVGSVLGLGL